MSRSPNPLVVQFLNVGQGDAAVVFLPESTAQGQPLPRRALVIDAFDGNAVLDALNARNVEEIVVFFTHSDWDHVNGAESLLSNFGGRLVALFANLDRSDSHTGSDYHQYLRICLAATRTTPPAWFDSFLTTLEQNERFRQLTGPSVRLRVLHPTHAHCVGLAGQSLNDQSGVLRVEYQPRNQLSPRTVLFTGDIQLTGISLMFEEHQADPSVLRADVLKFPHHGAWPTVYTGSRAFRGLTQRTMADFLAKVAPQMVVISAGLGNTHDHVRPDVFAAIRGQTSVLRIACTEFTRTCTAGCADPAPRHCAGDVTVTFLPNEDPHVEPGTPTHEGRIRLHTLPGTPGCEHLLTPVVPAPVPQPASSATAP